MGIYKHSTRTTHIINNNLEIHFVVILSAIINIDKLIITLIIIAAIITIDVNSSL